MTVIKKYTNGQWIPVVVGRQGPTGSTGPTGPETVFVSATPPISHGIIWVDTNDSATGETLYREVRSDWSAPYSYIGVAPYGSAESDPVWRITRIDVGPPVVQTVVTSTAWDNRLTAF